MPRLHIIVLASLAVLFVSTGARADTILLVANMTHSQETNRGFFQTSTGQPRPESFGTATFVLNTDDPLNPRLSFTATIFNIDVTGTQTPDTFDNLVAAHIHAPAPPGVNAGVRWGFFGTPFNDTLAPVTTLTPFASGVGGTFMGTWNGPEGNNTTLAEQLANILAGLSYINFHTTQFPGGEIRGQILQAVPEPATLLLLGTGLAGVVGAARRRRLARKG